jgi:hypothetical protein
MKKTVFFLTAFFIALGGSQAQAQSMTLRDAMYLYSQPVNTMGAEKRLIGYNCDVFELVLDVESGFTDLVMTEGSTVLNYPDRIDAGAAMFAYTLYAQEQIKSFTLLGTGPGATQQVGTATFFGYCFSTDPTGAVLLYDQADQSCRLSNGDVVPNCPVP